MTTSLDELNAMELTAFVGELGVLFDSCEWMAERAWLHRPFGDLADLHKAFVAIATDATEDEKVALLRAHPKLAGKALQEGSLPSFDNSEQSRLGLNALSTEELATMTRLNADYRERFGFPCIIALRLHETRQAVFEEFERRLQNTRQAESSNCLEQVYVILRLRLDNLFQQH